MRRLVLLMGLLGCDEPARGHQDADLDRGLDARRPDAGRDGVVVDGARPDARPDAARDVGVLEAGRPDAGPRDAGRPDAGPRDAQVVDAVVDAQIDAGPPAPCVGLVLPPPPDSPDGSEVCNYRDDDGDGLVDEGFPYDFIGEPVQVTGRLEPGQNELKLTWSGDGYGVSWTTAWGLRFLTLDAAGCPISAVMQIDQNPEGQPFLPDSHDMAYVGGRYAAVFTQQRRLVEGSPGGFGTFVQLFDRAGQPVGALVDLDPTLSHLRFNAIVPFNDQFAVFSTAYHPQRGGLSYSAFAILDQDGRIVQGPSHPYDALPGNGQGMDTFIGLAYDGEGFGMAWHGVGNWFMRWAPTGEVLTPPVRLSGGLADTSGIAWNHPHHAIPGRGNGLFDEGILLLFVDSTGIQPAWSPAEVGEDDLGGFAYSIAPKGSGWLLFGATDDEMVVDRLDHRGIRIGASTQIPRNLGPVAVVPVDSEPIKILFQDALPDGSGGAYFFSALGCRQ